MTKKNKNLLWHRAAITRLHREKQNGHKSVIIWFTGLPSSGKSTLSHALEEKLYEMGCRSVVLDGDNVRHGLCSDLGFDQKSREENIRRVGELAKLFIEAGMITMTAFISPFRTDRDRVRGLVPHGEFLEIHCDCPLDICEKRDPKGYYKRARSGEIKEFTGISSPYEPPFNPELKVDTTASVDECVDKVLELLVSRSFVDSR